MNQILLEGDKMSYEFELIKKEQLQVLKWSGGTTTQLAIFPKDAVYDERNFKWRLSTASVEVSESVFTKLPNIKRIIGTGYGRIALPFIDKAVTEITCHGKGAHFIDPSIRTVIDIGGQDSKVIKLDEKGNIIDFLMNDKCAAGTGRFLQVMSTTLGIDVSELSDIAYGATPQNINSMCTVFAESEIISLMASGASKESIAAGLLQSVCKKTYSLVSRVGVSERVFFSGGVSRNYLLKELLSEKFNIEIISSELSQFLGAIGASIIGYKNE